jgi:hypothetical protein
MGFAEKIHLLLGRLYRKHWVLGLKRHAGGVNYCDLRVPQFQAKLLMVDGIDWSGEGGEIRLLRLDQPNNTHRMNVGRDDLYLHPGDPDKKSWNQSNIAPPYHFTSSFRFGKEQLLAHILLDQICGFSFSTNVLMVLYYSS